MITFSSSLQGSIDRVSPLLGHFIDFRLALANQFLMGVIEGRGWGMYGSYCMLVLSVLGWSLTSYLLGFANLKRFLREDVFFVFRGIGGCKTGFGLSFLGKHEYVTIIYNMNMGLRSIAYQIFLQS